jgi:hypothetical protein
LSIVSKTWWSLIKTWDQNEHYIWVLIKPLWMFMLEGCQNFENFFKNYHFKIIAFNMSPKYNNTLNIFYFPLLHVTKFGYFLLWMITCLATSQIWKKWKTKKLLGHKVDPTKEANQSQPMCEWILRGTNNIREIAFFKSS